MLSFLAFLSFLMCLVILSTLTLVFLLANTAKCTLPHGNLHTTFNTATLLAEYLAQLHHLAALQSQAGGGLDACDLGGSLLDVPTSNTVVAPALTVAFVQDGDQPIKDLNTHGASVKRRRSTKLCEETKKRKHQE